MQADRDRQLSWVYDLYGIGQAIAREKPAAVQQRLLDHVVDGFEAVSGSIALVRDKENLVLAAGSGPASSLVESSIRIGDGVLGWVVQQKKPLLLIGGVSGDAHFKNLVDRTRENQPESSLCWPLIVDKRVIGAVSINRSFDQPVFTQDDVRRGEVMMGVVSLVVDNVRLHEAHQRRIKNLSRTNRKLAEQQAQLKRAHRKGIASETKLANILDIAPEAIIVVDEAQRISVFNKGAEKIFGYTAGEMMGKALDVLLPERFARTHHQHIKSFADTDEQIKRMKGRNEIVGKRKDGSEFPAGASISKMTLDGKLLFTTVLRDMTEEKLAEKTLRASEERFAMAVRGSNDGIWDWDLVSGEKYFSPRWREMLGYTEDEVKNRFLDMQNLIHADDLGFVLDAWTRCLEGEREGFSVEYRMLAKQGDYRWVHGRGFVLFDESGNPVRMAGSNADVTERKFAEEALEKEKVELASTIDQLRQANAQLREAQSQLLQSEKMASIGQLAAGVAHEINNPVGYVNSNIGTLKRYVADLFKVFSAYEKAEPMINDPAVLNDIQAVKEAVDLVYLQEDIRALLDESQDGVSRVKRIVQDLKDFSHVDESEWQWADLHKGLDSTLNIVHNEIKYRAEVIKEYGELPQVECIVSQLNQVFMNLLVNAAHAIEDHGAITVRTGTDGDSVWVDIIDTGKGMDAETQKQIFDPFFTTKPVGQGTGLGLSLSYGIMQKHSGRIEVDSEVDKGTTFRVWLPVRQREERAAS